jgi:hypothetical protein
MGRNRHAKGNVVIHGLKTRYMQFSEVKYPMCFFKSNSHSITFNSGRVKARFYIHDTCRTFIGTSSHGLKWRLCYAQEKSTLCPLSNQTLIQ